MVAARLKLTSGAIVCGLVMAGAAAQTPTQQDCNLLSSTVAATADWRDNGVPVLKAQANVAHVLDAMPASEKEKQKWHDAVAAIYSSKVSSEQVENALRTQCR